MIYIDGNTLTIDDVVAVAVNHEWTTINKNALKQIENSRDSLIKILKAGKPVYGVNTGFGSLLNTGVPDGLMEKLQVNLIRSHSSGIGDPLDENTVRAIMVVRANTLAKGYSGVSTELIDFLLFMLNHNIIPAVPKYGSVGSSGDLAPLAHVGLAIIGEGDVFYNGRKENAAVVFRELGTVPYHYKEKEGVALINGTSAMCGILALELKNAEKLINSAMGSFIMSFEALSGTSKAFTEWALAARPHPGQMIIGRSLRSMLSGSLIIKNADRSKIQDAYSLRCTPQVYGSVYDAISYARKALTVEINSATDNPLINGDDYVSAGNFHGEPIAIASDFAAIAMADFGNIIERRIARLVDSNLSGLPPFLIKDYGLNSGYMIPQYTAAALCNVNKTLAHPNSADTIPTSANQEDHVSMGTNAALKLREINDNVKSIIAIEYLLGAQALEFRKVDPSPVTLEVYRAVRNIVEPLTVDRPANPDLNAIIALMDSKEFQYFIGKRADIVFDP